MHQWTGQSVRFALEIWGRPGNRRFSRRQPSNRQPYFAPLLVIFSAMTKKRCGPIVQCVTLTGMLALCMCDALCDASNDTSLSQLFRLILLAP
eukprot:4807379-Amphidinium_carterae.1